MATRTKHKGKWCFFLFSDDGFWVRGFVHGSTTESGLPCYDVEWDNGLRELVFVGSVFRIQPDQKPVVVEFKKPSLVKVE